MRDDWETPVEGFERDEEKSRSRLAITMVVSFVAGIVGVRFWWNEADIGWLILAPIIVILGFAFLSGLVRSTLTRSKLSEALVVKKGRRQTAGQTVIWVAIAVACVGLGMAFLCLLGAKAKMVDCDICGKHIARNELNVDFADHICGDCVAHGLSSYAYGFCEECHTLRLNEEIKDGLCTSCGRFR